MNARQLVAALAAVAACVGGVTNVASCGPACRPIEFSLIDLECENNAQFRGELHLDSRAVYDTFLRDQCIASATEGQIEALRDDVDFARDAVFVASRARDEQLRCIVERAVEDVEVCDTGLRVTFVDKTSTDPVCPGRWTTAFSLSRDDLRTAIAEQVEPD